MGRSERSERSPPQSLPPGRKVLNATHPAFKYLLTSSTKVAPKTVRHINPPKTACRSSKTCEIPKKWHRQAEKQPLFCLTVKYQHYVNQLESWTGAPVEARPPKTDYFIRLRNSLRVRSSFRKMPLKADVVVMAFAFCTPLRVIHVCDASITTATPSGSRVSWMQSRIWVVSLSCTCSLRAKVSTTRAILLRPVMVPLGI